MTDLIKIRGAIQRLLQSWRAATASLIASLITLGLLSASGGDPVERDDSVAVQPTVDVASKTATPASTTSTTVEVEEPATLPVTWTNVNGPGVGGRITSVVFSPEDSDTLLVAGDVFGVARTTDGGAHWESTTGFTNWEIASLVFDPNDANIVWAGTMGGPFRSVDGGQTWSSMRSGMPSTVSEAYTAPIETILFDPDVDGRLLAVGGSQRQWLASGGRPLFGTIWESLDSGESWAAMATISNRGNIQAATFLGQSSQLLLAAVLDAGIYRSEDGGRTWRQSTTGLPHANVTNVVAHPTDAQRAWLTLGAGPLSGTEHLPGGVYMTSDGGLTWQPSLDGLSQLVWTDETLTARFEAIVVSPTNPDRLYAADLSYRNNAIYRSDDGGVSWTPLRVEGRDSVRAYSSGISARELSVDPNNPDAFMFGHDEELLISLDAGASALNLTTSKTDAGHFIGRGFSGIVATDVVFNPSVADDAVLLGFDGGNFIQTVDGFETYRRTLRSEGQEWGGAWRAAYAGPSGDRIYLLLGQASVFRGIGRSDDGGLTFEVSAGAEAGLPESNSKGTGSALLVDSTNPDVVLTVIDDQLLRSVDGAKSFEPFGVVASVYDIVQDDDGTTYLSSEQGLWISNDGGATADLIQGSPSDLRRLTLDPHHPSAVLAISAGTRPGLHRYAQSGWVYLLEGSDLQQVAIHPERSGLYVAVSQDLPFHDVSTATGISATTDGGLTWTFINEGLPLLRISAVAFDPHFPDRIVAGSYGRGFFQASIAGLLGEPSE